MMRRSRQNHATKQDRRDPLSAKGVQRDRSDFDKGLSGGPMTNGSLLNLSLRIPDGDRQLVASLRVAQDGRLLDRQRCVFTDRVAFARLNDRRKSMRRDQMFHLNLPVH